MWVLKLNDEEAELMGDPSELPVPEVLVTHGSRGATVYAGGRTDEVPAYAIGADPTGAGDGFCAAYIVSRSAGLAPAAAARRATAVVASVLAGVNALVATAAGTFSVDLETGEVEPWDGETSAPAQPALNLPTRRRRRVAG